MRFPSQLTNQLNNFNNIKIFRCLFWQSNKQQQFALQLVRGLLYLLFSLVFIEDYNDQNEKQISIITSCQAQVKLQKISIISTLNSQIIQKLIPWPFKERIIILQSCHLSEVKDRFLIDNERSNDAPSRAQCRLGQTNKS
ncbi:unnamed protein product [Paramecium octaurelia]|uniref:Uncharacterized protein n=1 Tax=Paramecium octaurelia TaxID=43137 RepID=A0A8S1YGV5_PAROT|nr:unnamed protein product [Paramecium octaurelia]